MKNILVIDDEADVADLLAINLRQRGQFAVATALDGTKGLRMAREQAPALIVLDLMLPGISGFEVCRLLKSNSATERIPILVLSARAGVDDRLRGLEMGADDYVTKPFSPREVVLRIGALARHDEESSGEGQWTGGQISINHARHEVSVGGKPVRLTVIEFKLLSYLIKTNGRTQSRDQLLTQVWDYSDSMTTRTVDVHMLRLRKKLGKASGAIETVRSYGYRFRNI